MQIRQALEAAGVDVFLDAATVRGLLPELERSLDFRCSFTGVVALSYAWPARCRKAGTTGWVRKGSGSGREGVGRADALQTARSECDV